jgi:hypothetical protein
LRHLGTIYQGTLSEPCRTVPTFQEADVESIVRDNCKPADRGFRFQAGEIAELSIAGIEAVSPSGSLKAAIGAPIALGHC